MCTGSCCACWPCTDCDKRAVRNTWFSRLQYSLCSLPCIDHAIKHATLNSGAAAAHPPARGHGHKCIDDYPAAPDQRTAALWHAAPSAARHIPRLVVWPDPLDLRPGIEHCTGHLEFGTLLWLRAVQGGRGQGQPQHRRQYQHLASSCIRPSFSGCRAGAAQAAAQRSGIGRQIIHMVSHPGSVHPSVCHHTLQHHHRWNWKGRRQMP